MAALAIATAIVVAGCGRSSLTGPAAGGEPSPTIDAETERTIEIYSTVVRQLIEVDHTFGGGEPPFERIFIVDGVVNRAGDPMGTDEEVDSRFSDSVREGIAERLVDLLPVEFVESRTAVAIGEDDCARVRDDGVVVSLGPIEGDSDRVEVPNELWFSCLGGQWLTYVLERDGDDWNVTGTTGPMAIS